MLFKEPITHDIIDNIVNEHEMFMRSPLSEALNLAISINNDYFNLRSKMVRLEHVSIKSEGTDTVLLSKGMSEFTYKSTEFFKRILDNFRQNVWETFQENISKQIEQDKKFVNENKDKFINADLCGFKFTGYRWTTPYSLPIIGGGYENMNVFSSGIKDLMNQTTDEIQKGYDMSQNDNTFNIIRSNALDVSEVVTGDTMINKCASLYRNGTTSKDIITCNDFSRLNILNTLAFQDIPLREMGKKYQEIYDFINSASVYTSASLGYLYDALEKSDETAEELSGFYDKYMLAFNTKFSWYIKMINIYIGIFSCRLDSYQAKLNEYREIVRTAVEYVGEEE